MAVLCDPKVKNKILYDFGIEIARIDNDNDFAVTCGDCGYKVHIPMKYIKELVGNWEKENEV